MKEFTDDEIRIISEHIHIMYGYIAAMAGYEKMEEDGLNTVYNDVIRIIFTKKEGEDA